MWLAVTQQRQHTPSPGLRASSSASGREAAWRCHYTHRTYDARMEEAEARMKEGAVIGTRASSFEKAEPHDELYVTWEAMTHNQ